MLFLLIILFAFMPLLYGNRAEQPEPKPLPPVTIWIHGTKLFPQHFFPKFFFCKDGLNPVLDHDPSYHHRTIAETLSKEDPELFPLETFYLFGWSGSLSFSARKKAALDLKNSLKQVVEHYYAKYRKRPFVRIITHSHGGNVVLSMADFEPYDFYVDELILLACPVQLKTKKCIQSSLFKHIISLYSTLDTFQILDPQGLYRNEIHAMQKMYDEKLNVPLFSERYFELQDNLHQFNVRINNRGLFHIEFMLLTFVKALPAIIRSIHKEPLNKDSKTTTTAQYSIKA